MYCTMIKAATTCSNTLQVKKSWQFLMKSLNYELYLKMFSEPTASSDIELFDND